MTTVSVRLPEEQAQMLRALAVAMDASVSAIIRGATDDYIDKHRARRVSQRRRGRIGEQGWEVFDLLTR
jgi:predicted transcriptional regulator